MTSLVPQILATARLIRTYDGLYRFEWDTATTHNLTPDGNIGEVLLAGAAGIYTELK